MAWLKTVISLCLNWIYPKLCVVCRSTLQSGELAICPYCSVDLPYSRGIMAKAQERLWVSPIFGDLYSVYAYNKGGSIQALMKAYKYHNRREIAELALERAKFIYPQLSRNYDLILAIPLKPEREIKRGYNQALIWAKALASWLGGEASDEYIIRIKQEYSQTQLTGLERRLSYQDKIFALNEKFALNWQEQRVLVVDDILTTGSTLTAYLDILECLGVKRADVFTMAVTI